MVNPTTIIRDHDIHVYIQNEQSKCCFLILKKIGYNSQRFWRNLLIAVVEQELLTLLDHLRSSPMYCWVRVVRYLVF